MGTAISERPATAAPGTEGRLDLFGSDREGANAITGAEPQPGVFRDPAFMANRDAPVHRWVPWIAGYSKHFVADALARHLDAPGVVLDPFAGVGTTLVEADLAGHQAVGFEINPYAAFASRMKLKAHRLSSSALREAVRGLADLAERAREQDLQPQAQPPEGFRTRAPFYSPGIQRLVLLALDFIATQPKPTAGVLRLAFAATMVEYSNYSYEPSLGRKSAVGRPDVDEFPVLERVAGKVAQIASDAAWFRASRSKRRRPDGRIIERSFLDGFRRLAEASVDLLVTSPPYLNNYHYNRNTRPHLYWLGFCRSPKDLKRLEMLNFGTYWQNARERERIDLAPTIQDEEIRETLAAVRRMRPDKGIYGGHGWANYAAQYFNDCARFAAAAKWCLRPAGTALVVVGNSILQGVPVPTDRFLASIAKACGLEVAAVHTPRETRVGSSIVDSGIRAGAANGQRLYESVVELRQCPRPAS